MQEFYSKHISDNNYIIKSLHDFIVNPLLQRKESSHVNKR